MNMMAGTDANPVAFAQLSSIETLFSTDFDEAMSAFPWFDAAIVLALIALNGVFAMSELAIVSARRPRLQAMTKAGKRGASIALRLSAA